MLIVYRKAAVYPSLIYILYIFNLLFIIIIIKESKSKQNADLNGNRVLAQKDPETQH